MILRNIIEIVVIRRQIVRLKCIKFDFCRGSAPHPAGWGSLQRWVSGFKGPTYKGGRERKGRGQERTEGWEAVGGHGRGWKGTGGSEEWKAGGKGKGREKRGGKGRRTVPANKNLVFFCPSITLVDFCHIH